MSDAKAAPQIPKYAKKKAVLFDFPPNNKAAAETLLQKESIATLISTKAETPKGFLLECGNEKNGSNLLRQLRLSKESAFGKEASVSIAHPCPWVVRVLLSPPSEVAPLRSSRSLITDPVQEVRLCMSPLPEDYLAQASEVIAIDQSVGFGADLIFWSEELAAYCAQGINMGSATQIPLVAFLLPPNVSSLIM